MKNKYIFLRFFLAVVVGFGTVLKFVLVIPLIKILRFLGKKLLEWTVLIVFFFCLTGLLSQCGCSHFQKVSPDDPFKTLFTSSIEKKNILPSSVTKSNRFLTLSALKVSLPLFCRILSDTFQIGVVYSDTLSDKVITAEFKKTDLESVLNVISRQIDCEVLNVGNTVFIGKPRPEDRAVFVRRVFGYSSDDLSKAVSSMLSADGKCQILDNSCLVVTDHATVISRVSQLISYLDSATCDCWIVQLVFLSLCKEDILEGGFNVNTSGTISYNVAENKISLENFTIDAIFSSASSNRHLDIHSSPMLLIRDGSTGTWKQGTRVPIPQKSVSDNGTVTISGYSYTDVGFTAKITPKKSLIGCNLTLDLEQSQITGYVQNEVPIVDQLVYNSSVDIACLKPYLVGELSIFKQTKSRESWLYFDRENGKTRLQVWCQVYRVSAPIIKYNHTEYTSEAPEVSKKTH